MTKNKSGLKQAFAMATILMASILTTNQASGALSLADSSLGADTIVVDSATGLDWLALSFTQGYSVDQILAATETGGSLEEFRLATRDELVTLIGSLGIPINNSCFDIVCFTNGQQFVTYFQGNEGLLAPITNSEPGLVELFSFRILLYPDSLEVAGDVQLVTRAPSIGSDAFFLVAEDTPPTSIPEPNSLVILLSALTISTLYRFVKERDKS